jgi:hypothetical protein
MSSCDMFVGTASSSVMHVVMSLMSARLQRNPPMISVDVPVS